MREQVPLVQFVGHGIGGAGVIIRFVLKKLTGFCLVGLKSKGDYVEDIVRWVLGQFLMLPE